MHVLIVALLCKLVKDSCECCCYTYTPLVFSSLIMSLCVSYCCYCFSADREEVGRCTLFSAFDSTETQVALNAYMRQDYSIFECLYDDILACPYVPVASSSNCTHDIVEYSDCVEPLLQSCRDSELVLSINTKIMADTIQCQGAVANETFNATDAYECNVYTASLSTCFGCCQDAYVLAKDQCNSLVELFDECVSDRYNALDVCAGVCVDARTTSQPQPPTPSTYVDVFVPLTLLGNIENNNVFQARLIASVASVFGFDEDELHLNITVSSSSSTEALLSTRLADTYTTPDTSTLSSSPSRRRRTAVDAANIASFFKQSGNTDVLLARLSAVLLSSLNDILSVSYSGSGISSSGGRK
eukprot:m.234190 g.234190  ORF g.234190 m.234190 type:complete len:357 (-) comp13913_c0_seq4:1715-2785(-)